MHQVESELAQIIAQLHSAAPDHSLWSGSAARACASELQEIVEFVYRLRASLLEVPEWMG
jgi:hypothetical protein